MKAIRKGRYDKALYATDYGMWVFAAGSVRANKQPPETLIGVYSPDCPEEWIIEDIVNFRWSE